MASPMMEIGGAMVIAILLLSSALLTAAHEAASQIGTSRLRTLQDEGFKGAAALTEVREQEVPVGRSVRVVTQSFNLTALGVAAWLGVATGGDAVHVAIVVVVGIVTVLLVAHVIPRSWAARRPVRLALSWAATLLRVTRWTRALTAPVEHLADRIVVGDDDELTTERRELLEIQELGTEEGVLEESENLLVERAFRFDELTAWDVMVPRVDIFAWKDDLTLEEIVDGLPDVPFSRVPVYHDSVDDVTGIVHVREVYERFARGDRQVTLGDLARAPFFVPGSLSLTQLLRDFQALRIHMGIVADEFGGTDGLVTLEDLLEELVGEIQDEMDAEEEEIVHVSEGSLECDAGVDIRELNDALDVSLPKAEHRSLNGFILEELGHVPPQGESFERAGVHIEILEATETHVLRARLTKVAKAPDPAD